MAKRTAIRLTETRVKNFKRKVDGPKTQRLWDIAERGLGIEVTQGGHKSWLFRYSPPGAQRQKIIKIGEYPTHSVDQAREIIQEKKRVLYEGRDPQRSAGMTTVDEWYKKYTSKKKDKDGNPIGNKIYLNSSKKSQNNFNYNMKKVIPVIGGYDVDKVTRRDILVVLNSVLRKGQEETCRKIHTTLNKLFSAAMSSDDIALYENPTLGFKMEYTKKKRKTRYLDDDEIRKIMDLDPLDPANLLIQWLLLTGARINEGRMAKWSDIDDGVWSIPKTKTVPNTLPLTDLMNKVLSSARILNGNRPYVFNSIRKFNKIVGENTIREKVRTRIADDLVPHTLRHTVSTRMRELSIPLEPRSLVLNHVLPGMSSRYTHGQALPFKREALETWHEDIRSIVSAGRGAASGESSA